jgi:ABC-type glycerol-3-phosphate transport system permease component
MLWTYAILIVVSLIVLFPFIWLVTSSLKSEFQYYAIPIQWIPNPVQFSNFVEVFTQYRFTHYVVNSLWLAAFAVVASLFSSALVAYGFARFRFPGRTVLFILVLATMMLPSQIMTIALYNIYKSLGWIDTFLPLMVPRLFGDAFSIFLFRQFFLGLPREIDEAARIVAIFLFLGSWRDAWTPLIYLSSDANRTVPLGLLFFSNPFKSVDPQLMAATLVALVVPVVLYALGQRYIDSGVAIADLK